MTIDLWGPDGRFGEMTFPELKLHPNGVPITIDRQLVSITSWRALQSFLEHLIHDDKITLVLDKGVAELQCKALQKTWRPVFFNRVVTMDGMNNAGFAVKGAKITAQPPKCFEVGGDRQGLKVMFHVKNPSLMELSLGLCCFEIRNEEGEVFAQLKGFLDMQIQYYEVQMCGVANKGVKIVKGKTRLQGVRCSGAGWCDEIIKGINVPVTDVWKLLKALDLEYEVPPAPSPEYFQWYGRWFKKDTWI